jgi:hypothetical protein
MNHDGGGKTVIDDMDKHLSLQPLSCAPMAFIHFALILLYLRTKLNYYNVLIHRPFIDILSGGRDGDEMGTVTRKEKWDLKDTAQVLSEKEEAWEQSAMRRWPQPVSSCGGHPGTVRRAAWFKRNEAPLLTWEMICWRMDFAEGNSSAGGRRKCHGVQAFFDKI